MKKRSGGSKAMQDLDRMIEEITTGANGDDEQLWAFHSAVEGGIDLPCDAFVIGEPVSVIAFDYDGNRRRGLVARCQREDGSEHVVSASEVVLADRSRGGHLPAAYRKWSGLDPQPEQTAHHTRHKRQHPSHAGVQMARELGMNPAKLGKLDNHRQEPWKLPLPQFVEKLYFKRFGKTVPDAVVSIEERARIEQQKKETRRAAKQQRATETA